MANCNRCGEVIFFAWHTDWQKWLPCELASIRDEDVELDIGGKPGLKYEKHHMRHRCGFKTARDAWAGAEHKQIPFRETVAYGVAPALGKKTAHATLFITYDAPIEVIRAAYKALAALYHPDLGGDPERMIELNQAYAALCQDRQSD